jgi:hypothetical protein
MPIALVASVTALYAFSTPPFESATKSRVVRRSVIGAAVGCWVPRRWRRSLLITVLKRRLSTATRR